MQQHNKPHNEPLKRCMHTVPEIFFPPVEITSVIQKSQKRWAGTVKGEQGLASTCRNDGQDASSKYN